MNLFYNQRFTVETRYPGDNASKRQAASALRWAGKVRHACRTFSVSDVQPAEFFVSPSIVFLPSLVFLVDKREKSR